MKASTRGLTSCSSNSLDAAVTMKSSAYRTKLTFAAIPLTVVFGKRSLNLLSKPSNVILASTGEMMPPYAKWKAMQSKCRKGLKLLHFSPIYFA